MISSQPAAQTHVSTSFMNNLFRLHLAAAAPSVLCNSSAVREREPEIISYISDDLAGPARKSTGTTTTTVQKRTRICVNTLRIATGEARERVSICANMSKSIIARALAS